MTALDERRVLRELTENIERDTGLDSIATIERVYPDDEGETCVCVYPECGYRRRDPVEMWWHVHFSDKHYKPSEGLDRWWYFIRPFSDRRDKQRSGR